MPPLAAACCPSATAARGRRSTRTCTQVDMGAGAGLFCFSSNASVGGRCAWQGACAVRLLLRLTSRCAHPVPSAPSLLPPAVDPAKTCTTPTDVLLYCFYGALLEIGRRASSRLPVPCQACGRAELRLLGDPAGSCSSARSRCHARRIPSRIPITPFQAALPARPGAAADRADGAHHGAQRHHRGLPQKVQPAVPAAPGHRARPAQAHLPPRHVRLVRGRPAAAVLCRGAAAGLCCRAWPARPPPPSHAALIPVCRRAQKSECGPYNELVRLCGQDKSAVELTTWALGKQAEFEAVRWRGGEQQKQPKRGQRQGSRAACWSASTCRSAPACCRATNPQHTAPLPLARSPCPPAGRQRGTGEAGGGGAGQAAGAAAHADVPHAQVLSLMWPACLLAKEVSCHGRLGA